MKKQLFIIALFMINFSTQLSAANPETRSYQSKDSTGLKILSWNIYMLPYISLLNHNSRRAKTIADRLSKSD